MLQVANPRVTLWDSAKHTTTSIDTGSKDLSFTRWSKLGPQLAIGTGRGSLILYNKDTRKTVHISGKHSKKITCGDWCRSTNILATGGQDNILVVRYRRVFSHVVCCMIAVLLVGAVWVCRHSDVTRWGVQNGG